MSNASSFHDERLPDPRSKSPGADGSIADAEARARALAGDLLSIGAVVLRPNAPFTWSSGLHAPIYCDNRRTLGVPAIRTSICEGFAEIVAQHELRPATVAGTATAGIPHAAWLADRLDQPMAYVRSSAKPHGRQNQIEGIVEPGDDVVVVEDLVSTGGSALSAVEALREAGTRVRAVLAIFSYGFDASAAAFQEAGVSLHTLTDYSTLIDVARSQDDISNDELATLRDWRRDPDAWSEQHATR